MRRQIPISRGRSRRRADPSLSRGRSRLTAEEFADVQHDDAAGVAAGRVGGAVVDAPGIAFELLGEAPPAAFALEPAVDLRAPAVQSVPEGAGDLAGAGEAQQVGVRLLVIGSRFGGLGDAVGVEAGLGRAGWLGAEITVGGPEGAEPPDAQAANIRQAAPAATIALFIPASRCPGSRCHRRGATESSAGLAHGTVRGQSRFVRTVFPVRVE